MNDPKNSELMMIRKSLRRANYIQILRNMYDAGMIDNNEYRDELKATAEIEGFETHKKFWLRSLF